MVKVAHRTRISNRQRKSSNDSQHSELQQLSTGCLNEREVRSVLPLSFSKKTTRNMLMTYELYVYW